MTDEATHHRIFVSWPGGYFISLGVVDKGFQEMVNDLGAPTVVEFRHTGEKWLSSEGSKVVVHRRPRFSPDGEDRYPTEKE